MGNIISIFKKKEESYSTDSILAKTRDGGKLIYLAVPYTHRFSKIRHRRFRLVTEVSAILAGFDVANISPITQSHVQAQHFDLGTEWETWKRIDTIFMNNSDEFWILEIDGWDRSVGVTAERKLAKKLKLPIRYILYDEHKKEIQISDSPRASK